MVKMLDELAWSYPWVHKYNCIKEFTASIMVYDISSVLNQSEDSKQKLYEIYRNGVENCRNYHIDNYIPNYVLDSIASALHDA